MHVATFRAMGSACRIVTDGPKALASAARSMVEDLDTRWSRFNAESEISNLNNHSGHIVLLSPNTFSLVQHGEAARVATTGRFNPLMLSQLESLGYERDWAEGPTPADWDSIESASHQPIELFEEIGAARLPPGCRFDPGGIGKGLAADLVTDFLVNEGAQSTSVELGGDLRVTGTPWYGPAWRIGVAHPFDPLLEIGAFTPSHGAVATSSRLGKAWSDKAEPLHHLLDPATGLPADTDVVEASCCAATAWWAEVVAKAALISGAEAGLELMDRLDVAGIVVTCDGSVRSTQDHSANSRTGVAA